MNFMFLIISLASIVSILIFASMRNTSAGRNDKRRDRLEKRDDELKEILGRKNSPTENNTNDES